jgi:hypothetical protein
MKKLIAMICASSLLLFSCSKDDESDAARKMNSLTVSQEGNLLHFEYTTDDDFDSYDISYDFASNTLPPGATNDFNTILHRETSKTTEELRITLNSTFRFHIRGNYNNNSSDWYGPVDVEIQDFCAAPHNLKYDGAFGGTLYWSPNEFSTEPNMYEVEYGKLGFALGSGTTVAPGTSTSTNELMLQDNEVYEAYVRAYCNSELGWSAWSSPLAFTIDGNSNLCIPPTNIDVQKGYNSDGRINHLRFNWNDSGANDSYEAVLVQSESSPESGDIILVDDTEADFAELFPLGFEYDFYVRTICLDGTKTDWAGPERVYID